MIAEQLLKSNKNVERSSVPVSEPAPIVVTEPIKAAHESVEEQIIDVESSNVPDEEAGTVLISETGFSQQLERSNIMEKLAEENTAKALVPESRKQRRSIINDSVDVKRDMANDPEVASILELFNGDIIDIHR